MADIQSLVVGLANQVGIGTDSLMLPTAYDTAWVARIRHEEDRVTLAFPKALQWLRDNQLPDGSWGAANIEYVHDRILCTLAAVIALAEGGRGDGDVERVERGVQYVIRRTSLLAEEVETSGFEMIVPALLDTCAQLGLSLPQEPFARYRLMRAQKLSRVSKDALYSKDTTFAHSLEFMGDELDPQQVQQEADGSVAESPAATAYLLTHVNNAVAWRYVTKVVQFCNGQIPHFAPFDVFETLWVLWNLQLAGIDLRTIAGEHLIELQTLHQRRGAVGFSLHYSVPDADDTAVLLSILRKTGGKIQPHVLEPFFQGGHYASFTTEQTPSPSVNVHVLHALNGVDGKTRQCIVDYLTEQQCAEGFWVDKWHASPYYATGHAVIVLSELDGTEHLLRPAIDWLLDTCTKGTWGYYGPTAEETAYSLQALVIAARQGLCPASAVRQAMEGGKVYLEQHLDDQCPPALWFAKCLYAPVRMVQSAILSAYLMVQDYLGQDAA